MELGAAKQKIVDYCVVNNISVQQLKDANTALMAAMLEVNNINPHTTRRLARHSVKPLCEAQGVAFKTFLRNQLTGDGRVALRETFPDFQTIETIDPDGDVCVGVYPYGRAGYDARQAKIMAENK